MHFAVDIDQTVCGSNAHDIYASFHSEDLHLQISPLVLHQITSYRDFLLLPQVQSFRKTNEQEWNASRHRAIANPDVLRAFSPIEGAAQGVELLSHYGDVCYYTARIPEVREVTQQWLEHHHFIQSQNVQCCASIEQKILALVHHQPEDEPIVLIDDRGHTHFLSMLERVKEDITTQPLLKRLAILAFGASSSTLPETPLCRLRALPAWDQLQTILSFSLALD